MRILCTTFGSAGDVFPMLGLALALRARGHFVTLATNAYYGRIAEEIGLPFEPLGTESQFRESMRHPDLWHPRRSFGHLFRTLELAREQQFELFAKFYSRGPFLGIGNCISFGALTAAEKLGFPFVTTHIQPAVLWSDIKPPKLPGLFGSRWMKKMIVRIGEKLYIDPVSLPTLNRWRQQLRLKPIQRLTSWWHSRDGVLCMFPDWFGPRQADWPQPLEQTEFPLWNFQREDNLPNELLRFLDQGDAPIVFTPGSANLQARKFFETAVDTCALLKKRGVLLTEFEEHLPPHAPSSVARFPYVPLDLLLNRCCAIVHHGGVGTSSQGMLAGIPQVIMPMAYDQFDNAERLKELGIGAQVSVRSFRAPLVARAIEALLESPATNANCSRIAQRLARRDGLEQSARALERLVERHAIP